MKFYYDNSKVKNPEDGNRVDCFCETSNHDVVVLWNLGDSGRVEL